jgi:flagellar protein FliO/FliZ
MTTLDTGPWMQAGAALAGVLLLLWLAARLARRTGLGGGREGRRLAVQEVLAVDARRRLLLVRCDGREMLLLTGGAEDSMLGWLPPGRDAAP